MPGREPGAQEKGMFSCLDFGKSHRKAAFESSHYSFCQAAPDRQVRMRGVCPIGKESALHRGDSGFCPRQLVLQRTWRVSGACWS